MLILDLWGISFHAVVVFGLGKNLLFKSILGRCGEFDTKEENSFELLSYAFVRKANVGTQQIFDEK